MKTAIVTGCSRGLGQALKTQLEQRGYTVLGSTRQQMDVRHCSSITSFALSVLREHKWLNLLVNNAAVLKDIHDILAVSDNSLAETMQVNAFGALAVTRAFWPMLKAAHGHVINVSSPDAFCLDECRASYAVSKAALDAISKKLNLAGRPHGVTVVSVHPSWFRSGMGGDKAPMSSHETANDILTQIL